MDIDNIFDLFENENKGKGKGKNLDLPSESLKDTPYFKVGMFKKMIFNGSAFKKQILNFLSKSSEKLNLDEVEEAGEFMVFTRAYFWLEECKVRSKSWKIALNDYTDDELLWALKMSINYFEGEEEYEKCAHLKKIQNLVEKNLDK